MVLPEIVWVLGRTWVVPKGVPSDCYCLGEGGVASLRSPLLCKEGRGEVEILPAYTNHGSPARPSLWMPLPLLASPYKGEETGWRPHKSLKSQINLDAIPNVRQIRRAARSQREENQSRPKNPNTQRTIRVIIEWLSET